MEKSNKKIIICIPTRNRQKELTRLLISLSRQENIPVGFTFEVLLINNDENSYLKTIIAEIGDFPFAIHLIDVKQRGFSNVRNAAVSWVLESDMDALIFIDDDEVVPPDWLAKMINAWMKYKGDIITGPVRQVLPLSASRFVKVFHLLDTNYYNKSGQKLQYASSNNTLVLRKVLNAMGPTFHPSLNRSGGEDALYFHQAYLKGFTIYWDKSILIEEPTGSERATTRYVLYRYFHYGMHLIGRHRILYPEDWMNISFKFILRHCFNILRGFVASIVRLDKIRFGKTVCNLASLGGLMTQFFGITTTNRIYNK